MKNIGHYLEDQELLYENASRTRAAIEQITAGEPVWFGCDVGKHLDRDLGVYIELARTYQRRKKWPTR